MDRSKINDDQVAMVEDTCETTILPACDAGGWVGVQRGWIILLTSMPKRDMIVSWLESFYGESSVATFQLGSIGELVSNGSGWLEVVDL